jgi:hypothetical protein
MHGTQCPKCGSSNLEQRTVNDRLWASDLRGEAFEVALQVPVWSCRACKLCWQGEEALSAKEAAYQSAIAQRSPTRVSA